MLKGRFLHLRSGNDELEAKGSSASSPPLSQNGFAVDGIGTVARPFND
jgi:hypothetical protein